MSTADFYAVKMWGWPAPVLEGPFSDADQALAWLDANHTDQTPYHLLEINPARAVQEVSERLVGKVLTVTSYDPPNLEETTALCTHVDDTYIHLQEPTKLFSTSIIRKYIVNVEETS